MHLDQKNEHRQRSPKTEPYSTPMFLGRLLSKIEWDENAFGNRNLAAEWEAERKYKHTL